MKYVIILGDGMADLPLAEANGKTPLELADKPWMGPVRQKSEPWDF